MNKEPIFEIVRSYSRTKQIEQYEPRNYFCSAKQVFYEMPSPKDKELASEELDIFCKLEVVKSISADLKAKEDKTNKKGIRAEKREKSSEEGLEEVNLGL
mgnify:CR=1 FL=1